MKRFLRGGGLLTVLYCASTILIVYLLFSKRYRPDASSCSQFVMHSLGSIRAAERLQRFWMPFLSAVVVAWLITGAYWVYSETACVRASEALLRSLNPVDRRIQRCFTL